MAISEDAPQIEVTITVDGQAVKEYTDSELKDEDRTVNRYIEASSGQIFAVRLSIGRRFKFRSHCVAFQIEVDGKWADSAIIEMSDNRIRISKGRNADAGTKLQRYRFASFETVSDNYARKDELEQAKDLGTIRIVCTHNRIGAETNWSETDEEDGPGILSEKVLKGRALSHTIDFTDKVALDETDTPSVYESWAIRSKYNPISTFVFHYRSLAALKSMLIIPRTPTPPPPEERDVSQLSHEEMVEHMRELQRLVREGKKKEADQVKVKREQEDSNSRPRNLYDVIEID